jgi:glutamine synthetase
VGEKKFTKEDIFRIVEEEDVKFVRLQFVDVLGTLKNVAITNDQLKKALDNNMIFDGASIAGFVRSEESDMFLVPDLDTFDIFPWRPLQGKVARLICDIYTSDNLPYKADPRGVLKAVVAEASDMGYNLKLGPEFEFFLFHTDENGKATTETHDRAGYFDLGPIDLGENVRRDIVLTLGEMGYGIEASHHEVAPGQHEIDFTASDVLQAADQIVTIKLVVKVIARKHGLHATFMPKPIFGVDGSGMHCNLSLYDSEGKNVFYKDNEEGLSDIAKYFIGGLIKHAKGMTAITNPTVNSYKRLVQGFAAPTFIGWSRMNANPFIRIPYCRNQDPRIEIRNPDPSCNPYLALAVILKAGLDGIKNKIIPPEMIANKEFFENKKNIDKELLLPSDLNVALEELEKDTVMRETLKDIYESYVNEKRLEWDDYKSTIHDWEIEHYISRY